MTHASHAPHSIPEALTERCRPPGAPPVVAGIGSRDLTPAKVTLVQNIARWCAQRGFLVQSGGARGADTVWAEAFAAVTPRGVTVSVPTPDGPERRRVPRGALVRVPPYPTWVEELAVAEYEFRTRLPHIGLPPYTDRTLQARFDARKAWTWARATRPADLPLMTRNAALLLVGDLSDPATVRPVDIVLGLLNSKPGGGGTGHAFHLAQAMGIPTFDLRDPVQRAAARTALATLARGERLPRWTSSPSSKPDHPTLFDDVEGNASTGRRSRRP